MCGPSSALTSMPGTIRTSGRILSASTTPDGVLWSVIARPTPFFLASVRADRTFVYASEWFVWKCMSTGWKPRFPDVLDHRPFEADVLEDPVVLHACLQ